ncbi:MAG: hypothetical protein HQK89_01860 [Nitrospirae bacterium]|nr:hypothetical protein [Nitrospirota bacterium]
MTSESSNPAGGIKLTDTAIIGRTMSEYSAMFSLAAHDMEGENILDFAAGCSSFCAEANAMGYKVTAADRIYGSNHETIESAFSRDMDVVMGQMPELMHMYRWDGPFKNLGDLIDQRKRAFSAFIRDFRAYGDLRYVHCRLPHTGFEDKRFTLCLISHFLFLYEHILDIRFHVDVLSEALRIASKEVRVFPLVNFKGRQASILSPVMEELNARGYYCHIRKTDYEFVKNGNEMLVVSTRV